MKNTYPHIAETLKKSSAELLSDRRITAAFGVAAVMGAALTSDLLVATHSRSKRSKEASVTTYKGVGDQSTVVLPGSRANGAKLVPLLEPQLSELGDSHFVSYPEREFDLESVKEGLLDARRGSTETPADIVAFSMGGMVLRQLLRDEEFRDGFGKINRVILDSSPSSMRDIKARPRAAIWGARTLRGSQLASDVSGRLLYKNSLLTEVSPDAAKNADIADYLRTIAHAPLDVVEAQADFMKQSGEIKPGELRGKVDSVTYLRAEADPVISVGNAYRSYDQAFDGKAKLVIDQSRLVNSHASGAVSPDALLTHLHKKDDYELIK